MFGDRDIVSRSRQISENTGNDLILWPDSNITFRSNFVSCCRTKVWVILKGEKQIQFFEDISKIFKDQTLYHFLKECKDFSGERINMFSFLGFLGTPDL